MVRIEHLARHRNWIDQIARLHFEQWGFLTGYETLELYSEALERFAGDDSIPFVLVAFAAEQLLGSVSIVDCDMQVRSNLTPWLAQLLVVPRERGQGIGAALVRTAMAEVSRSGFPRLYLYTSGDLPLYYERFGWKVREIIPYLGKQRTVMHYEFSDYHASRMRC